MSTPNPHKKHVLGVRVSEVVRSQLISFAASRGTTLAALINESIYQYLDREWKKRNEKTPNDNEAQHSR